MNQPASSPPPSANLRALLIVVGVLMCLSVFLCGGGLAWSAWKISSFYSIVLTTASSASPTGGGSGTFPSSPSTPGSPSHYPWLGLWPAILTYLVSGAAILVLGVGVIRCRRWAWKMSLSAGWFWVGLVAAIGIASFILLPAQIRQANEMLNWSMTISPPGGTPAPAVPPTSMPSMNTMGATITVSTVLTLLLISTPGVILITVFSLRNARLTCEHRDPVPRWTDRTPMPVLVLWILLIVPGLALLLAMTDWSESFLQPVPGVGGLVLWKMPSALAALLCAVAAVGVSRLKRWGWCLGFTTFLVSGILITLAIHRSSTSMNSFYDEMAGASDVLFEMPLMQPLPWWQSLTAFFGLILLYMLFTLRYFRNKPTVATGPGDPSDPCHPPATT